MYKNPKYYREIAFSEIQSHSFVIQMCNKKRDSNISIRLPGELKTLLNFDRKDMSEADYIISILSHRLRNIEIPSKERNIAWQKECEEYFN